MLRALMVWILCCGSCFADEWSRADTGREVTYLIVDAVDWAQTLQISKNCHTPLKTVMVGEKLYLDGGDYQKHAHFIESNPLLGTCPSSDKVNAYFAIGMLAHVALSYSLPKDWRRGFQYVSIGFEVGMVHRNRMLGISARF